MTTLQEAGTKYLGFVTATKAKAKPTITKEACALGGWFDFTGTTNLGDFGREEINAYAMERAEEGVSNRTINLDVLALRHVLLFSRDSGLIPSDLPLVTDSWKPLKHTTPRRDLMPHSDVAAFVAEALRPMAHYRGQFLADYIKLLAYSGARKTAGLKAEWKNVNWQAKQITFFTKFDKWVTVDMNPKLEAHLRDMEARRTPSPFLFPGDFDGHQGDPHKSFDAVRTAISRTNVTLHDFRHYFASHAVMATQDIMLVSQWLGHSDGGKLVMKCYGHLCDKHRQQLAKQVVF